MATTAGLSKGVFVFKGKKKVANAEAYFTCGEDTDGARERQLLCEQLWDQTNMYIQVLQTELNTRLFDDMVTFIDGAQARFEPGKGRIGGSQIIREVPTAALVTGVNMPDHGSLFSNLATAVTERITPYVATVVSKDCPNVHTMITKVVSQVMDNADLLNDDDEEDEGTVSTKKLNGSMEVLSAWYKHVTKKPSSGKRRKSTDGSVAARYPPVVIVLEDLEGFQGHVLQDFVTICSSHLAYLPLVLVMGVATTVTTVHRLLPHAVSSHLCIERFQAPPASEYLTQVLNQVLFTPTTPFKLGPKVFNLLLDVFLYHDFSIVNFVRGIQFALVNHFFNQPWSLLCQEPEEAASHLKQMSHEQLDLLRSQKSFRQYVEQCEPQEQIDLLENDRYTKQQVLGLLEDIHQYHTCYFPVLRCLHALTTTLPKYPLGKQLREVYASNLSCDIGELPEYLHALGLLKTLSRDELTLRLGELSELLDNNDLPPELIEVRTSILEHLLKVANMEEMAVEETVEEPEAAPVLLPKKMDMYTLKQTLKQMDKTKRLTLYETLRNECIDYLDMVFRRYLRSPMSLPLNEVFYYDDVTLIRQTLNAAPRIILQSALSKPYTYLQAQGCVCDSNIPPTLPDICIAYKLHLECGRLINLYDWLQAFLTVVQASEVADGPQKKPDKTLQARFIRAVSELQFLGFVKSTKRKTDHVARLTWGGC